MRPSQPQKVTDTTRFDPIKDELDEHESYALDREWFQQSWYAKNRLKDYANQSLSIAWRCKLTRMINRSKIPLSQIIAELGASDHIRRYLVKHESLEKLFEIEHGVSDDEQFPLPPQGLPSRLALSLGVESQDLAPDEQEQIRAMVFIILRTEIPPTEFTTEEFQELLDDVQRFASYARQCWYRNIARRDRRLSKTALSAISQARTRNRDSVQDARSVRRVAKTLGRILFRIKES